MLAAEDERVAGQEEAAARTAGVAGKEIDRDSGEETEAGGGGGGQEERAVADGQPAQPGEGRPGQQPHYAHGAPEEEGGGALGLAHQPQQGSADLWQEVAGRQ